MRHLDLFSGIGGFALAARNVWAQDHEIISFCEIDSYCQTVLKKHWPAAPCHEDIKTLKGDSFGTIDLLTGGFPCQPFSVAGKQGGSEDDRYLWPEMYRVIQEAKPTWIIGENVAGLTNMVQYDSEPPMDSKRIGIGEIGDLFSRTGRGILLKVVEEIESERYEVIPLIIPACGVDAKHRRDRVWIVAHAKHNGCFKGEGARKNPGIQSEGPPRKNIGKHSEGAGSLRAKTVANNEKRLDRTHHPREEERQKQKPRESPGGRNVPNSESISKRTGLCQGEQGEVGRGRSRNEDSEGNTWPVEPGVGRVANGVPSRVDRLKGLGNAIVPQCVIPIMQAIKNLEDNHGS